MKFLIFGGTGFVGSNLKNYLEENGGEVVSVSRSGSENSLAIDITEASEFSKIDFQPDVVINCASRIPAKGKNSGDPDFLKELFMTNVVGGVNIANWAVEKKIPKLINCSTLVVVQKPWPTPLTEEHVALPGGFHVGYSMSKLSQEQIMNECVLGSETKLLHLRLSAVYGTEMTPEGIIFQLLKKAHGNEEILLTNAKKNTLDLINVEDVSKAVFEIAQNDLATETGTMNVASGKEISIYELAETIKKLTESKSEINNTATTNTASRANIDVKRLKQSIGEVYNNFILLEAGLKAIVDKHKV